MPDPEVINHEEGQIGLTEPPKGKGLGQGIPPPHRSQLAGVGYTAVALAEKLANYMQKTLSFVRICVTILHIFVAF